MNDYKGQKQGLLIAEFTGQDSDITVNFWDHSSFRWVNIDEAMAIIHPLRQESFKKYLEYFQEFIKETKD
jgi:putative (di)nucleoside polyphosphate hydrolase